MPEIKRISSPDAASVKRWSATEWSISPDKWI